MVNPAILRERQRVLQQQKQQDRAKSLEQERLSRQTVQPTIDPVQREINQLIVKIKRVNTSNANRKKAVRRLNELRKQQGKGAVQYNVRDRQFGAFQGTQVGTVRDAFGNKIVVGTTDPSKLRKIQKKQIKQDLKTLAVKEPERKRQKEKSSLKTIVKPKVTPVIAKQENKFDDFRARILAGLEKRNKRSESILQKELKKASFRNEARKELKRRIQSKYEKSPFFSTRVLGFIRDKLDISPDLLFFSEKSFIGSKQLGKDLVNIGDRVFTTQAIVAANALEAQSKGAGKKFIKETARAFKSQSKDSATAAKRAVKEAMKDPSTYALAVLGARPVRGGGKALIKAENNLFKVSKSLGKKAKAKTPTPKGTKPAPRKKPKSPKIKGAFTEKFTPEGTRRGKRVPKREVLQRTRKTRDIIFERDKLTPVRGKVVETFVRTKTGKKKVLTTKQIEIKKPGPSKTLKGGIGRKPSSQTKIRQGRNPQVKGIARSGFKTQILTDFGRIEITKTNKFINSALKNVKKAEKTKQLPSATGQVLKPLTKKQNVELRGIEKALNRVKKGTASTKDVNTVNRFIKQPEYRGLVKQSQPTPKGPTTKPGSTGREKVRADIVKKLKSKQRQSRREKLIKSKQKGDSKTLAQRKAQRKQVKENKKRALAPTKRATKISFRGDLQTAFKHIAKLSAIPGIDASTTVKTSSGQIINNLNDVRSDTKPIITTDVSNLPKQDVDRVVRSIPEQDADVKITTTQITTSRSKTIKPKQPKKPTKKTPSSSTPKRPQKTPKIPKKSIKYRKRSTIKKTTPKKPKIPKIPKDDKKEKKRKPKTKTGYIGQVRTRSGFKPTHTRALPRNRSLRNAARIADNSTSASIKTIKTKKKTKAKEIKQDKILKKFRRSKKRKDTLVEKRKFRIDSKGEKAGVTAKGLLAKKRKAAKKRKTIKRKTSKKRVSRKRSTRTKKR